MNTKTRAEQAEIAPLWLTYREAAAVSGLGRTTLWTLVSTGKVKAARVGRAVRINNQSLQDYLESQSYADSAGK